MGIDATRSEGNIDKFHGYLEGVVDGQKHFLDKACKYLESVLEYDLGYYGAAEFVDNFRKVMEG